MGLFGFFDKKKDGSKSEPSNNKTASEAPGANKTNSNAAAPELSLEERYGKASLAAYKGGSWSVAEKEFIKLESEGCTEASVALGQLYTQKDNAKAIEHFRKAADRGVAEAAWGVAALLGHEYVPSIDGTDAEWFKYCLIAANGGCNDAMNELGNVYKRMNKSFASFYWYLKAAYYEHRDGWFSVQATVNNIKANPSLEETEDIRGISKEESDNARKILHVFSGKDRLDQARMDEFMHAAMGDTEIMGMFIGNFFEQQKMDGNSKLGYQLAAHSNSIIGMKCLADMQAAGRGCERDMQKALEWYQGAAEAGHAQSAFVVAQMYRNRPYMAAYWYSVAIRRGFHPAFQAIQNL